MLCDPQEGMSRAVLLLTATPMQLDRFELYSLVELLDPLLFPHFEDFDAHCNRLAGLNATVDRLQRWSQLPVQERDTALRDRASLVSQRAAYL
jgi:hypothetical protein